MATQLVHGIESDGFTALVFDESLYLELLHELVHALSLKLLPDSGSIMRYNYMPKMVDVMKASYSVVLIGFGQPQGGAVNWIWRMQGRSKDWQPLLQ